MRKTAQAPARRFREKEKITAAEIISCPNLITEPTHYYKNGNCRCFISDAKEMEEAGLQWDGFQWFKPILTAAELRSRKV